MKKKISLILLVSIFLCVATTAFICKARLGKLPSGERLKLIMASPNYVEGTFRNQIPTPMSSSDKSRFALLWDFLTTSQEGLKPKHPLPVIKTDLKALDGNHDTMVWLGHSSSFLRLGGKNILIDPAFSSYASPLFFLNKAFEGDYPYSPEDMPAIDYLIISHDHWDHLDYPTLIALKSKIKTIICPLGVGAHLEYWGFENSIIHEADWYEELKLEPDFTVHVLPARHFSGRFINDNHTLWAGFMLEISGRRVFYSGDSGYGPHFAEIGEKFGEVDLAIMENGQYGQDWKYIHMMPEEAVQGAIDLNAKAILPVHSGRFSISYHPWDEPYKRITAASQNQNIRLLTPRMGEIVDMENPNQSFTQWWN